MKKILLLDNYDSFLYNISHIVEKLGYEIDVFRNDKIELDRVGEYDKIILSPGPGVPSDAGILLDVIRKYGATKSILGICLGEQGIAEVYGGKLENLTNVFHGIASIVEKCAEEPLFDGIENRFEVGRYHSWCVDDNGLPDCLVVTARDVEQGRIMAIKHKEYDVRGVQFHPESILTPQGETIISNWLKM